MSMSYDGGDAVRSAGYVDLRKRDGLTLGFGRALYEDAWFERPSLRVDDAREWAEGKAVVVVNGCFDLWHAGHATLMHCARATADRAGRDRGVEGVVVALIDADERVARAKGPARPILEYVEREAQVCRTRVVDATAEVADDETFVALVDALRPVARVRSSTEQSERTSGGYTSRIPHVPVRFARDVSGVSTSEIIRRIAGRIRFHGESATLGNTNPER